MESRFHIACPPLFHKVRVRQPGAASGRRAAVAALKRMIEGYPWLRDFARLLGLSLSPGPYA